MSFVVHLPAVPVVALPGLHLGADLPPPINAHQALAVQFDPVAAVLILGAAGLYLWGVWRVNRLQPRHRWPLWRTAMFMAGLFAILVGLESVIGVYDDVLFWDHMIQHLLLIMVAGPLLALGAPLLLAFRASTGKGRQMVAKALRSPVSRFFDNPLVVYVLYAVLIPLTHLTSFYNYTLTNQTVHDLEHLLYVVIGYLFWRQVVAAEPSCHRMHPGLRLAFLAFAVPIDTFTGLTLANETKEIFPAYTAMHRTWGVSLVQDLHIGGTIMWVGGDTLMFLPMIPVAVAWVHYEERRAERADRELDQAQGVPAVPVLPAAPTGVGPGQVPGGAGPPGVS